MSIMIDTAQITGALAFAAGLGTAWALLGRPIIRTLSELRELKEALKGEPAMPELGRPERPGLFVTVVRLADVQAAQSSTIDAIRHELQTNGGDSVKDALMAVLRDVRQIKLSADQRETERAARDDVQST